MRRTRIALGTGLLLVVFAVTSPDLQAAHDTPHHKPGSNQPPSPGGSADQDRHGEFTGEVKFVFYVKDVRKTVELFRGALGFKFHSYHDYDTGKSVIEWTEPKPPIYAEMSAGGQRFGIHLPQNPKDEASVGRGKIYFRVQDVDAHHRRVKAWGVAATPIRDTAWMRMFAVTDPDGHRIYFAATDPAVHTFDPW